MKIAVIGAGITGVTTAYFLTQKGFKVDLIESRRYPAMATSYANGGQLSASNSEAWNSWNNTLYGIKSLFSNNSSVILNPKISLSKINWLMNFIFAIKYKDIPLEKLVELNDYSINLKSEKGNKSNNYSEIEVQFIKYANWRRDYIIKTILQV